MAQIPTGNKAGHFRSTTLRYAGALGAVLAAFLIASILAQRGMRDPRASILLAGIAVSVWYCGPGPGILAIALSVVGLHVLIPSQNAWFIIGVDDMPYFCIFLLFGSLIHQFSRSLRKAERWILAAQNRLEEDVAARTLELTRLNTEYQTILDAVPFGIALFGPNGIVRRCSLAYETILGWAPGEIVGRPVPLPESEEKTWRQTEEGMRQGQGFAGYDGLRIRKDGSIFPAAISATPLFDPDGTYAGLVESIVDNTERQAQEAERQMLSALVEHSPDFVGVAGIDLRAVFVNRAGQRLFGLSGDEQVRQTSVLDYFAEDQRGVAQERLLPALLEHGCLKFETLARNFTTGKELPIFCTCFVIPDAKTRRPAFVAAVARDITERRKAEEQLQIFSSVVQNSPDFIGIAGLDLKLTFANPAAKAQFGLQTDDEVKQTNALDYFAEEDRKQVQEELIPALLEQGFLRFEVPARNVKTGQTFPALWTTFVVRDPKSGRPALLAAAVRDISERKRNEDELHRRAAYLTEAQSISHTGSWAWKAATGTGEWSEELFRILGLDPVVSVPCPMTYFERIHSEDRPAFEKVWTEATTERREFDHEHRILRPDGSVRHVRRLGRPFQAEGEEPEFIGTVMDMTDQWKAKADQATALTTITKLLDEVRALERKASREVVTLKEQNLLLKREFHRETLFKEIIGSSSALEGTLARVAHAAPTDSTVLITGETGTGKELIAHAIHKASPRADKPFISFNCAAVLPSLIASELFGHERGSFTGAEQRRLGRFELAEGGTIFLDEVGDIPPETQIALLRILQEREFERVGGNTRIRTDVRVVAATNRDLRALIEKERFRSDLFYRLSVFPIQVPPLRERREDIPGLVSHFVQLYARKFDKEISQIDKRTMDRLQAYDWPGNVRELQNLIERSVIISDGGMLVVDERMVAGDGPQLGFGTYQEEMDNHERAIILDALLQSHGRVSGPSGAAAKLGLAQSTLATRIAALKINKRQFSPD
jgi:PAS domain S-box-containing protein